MTNDRHRRVSELFLEAGKLTPGKRRAYLEKECAGQPDLLREVESLLNHEDAGAKLFEVEPTAAGPRPWGEEQPQPDPPPAAPVEAGLMLSHYRLISKIGEGGMGVVWKAKDTILNRDVAIKVLPTHVIGDPQRRDQFLQEARLASTVSDAHIVQVHEFGHEHDLDFLVMEFVEGKPLSDILLGRHLPAHKVAHYGYQLARALSRAHHKNLLHRDLKPSNILVTPEDDLKVVDFGLATLYRQLGSSMTTATIEKKSAEVTNRLIAGTLAYMSPEQTRGELLDARSDIFSLGVVLYEMTTNQRPFTGETADELKRQILQAHPRPPHSLVREIPMDLEWILRKILSPHRGDRYQTMGDLAVDLKRLRRDLDAGTALWFGKVNPEPKRTPWLRASMLGLALVLAAFLGYGVSSLIKSDEQQDLMDASPAALVWYQRGLEYFHRMDELPRSLDYAIQMFNRAVDNDDDFAIAWAALGEACWLRYAETDDAVWRDRAVEAVQAAFRLQPDLPEAHLARGYGLYLEGSLQDAREELQMAINKRPDLDRAWVVLGQTCQRLGEYAASRRAFEKAIELRPDDFRYQLWLGYFFKDFSEYDAAVSAFEKARDLKPDSPKTWNSLAGALIPLSRFQEARDALLRSVEIEETATSRDLLGTAFYYLEDHEKAIENYRRATSLQPDNPTHWANLGDALKVLDKKEDAREAYSEAARLAQNETNQNPLDPEAHKKLGLYCARANDHQCAIREGKLAEALEPQNTEILFRVAIIFYLVGEVDEALDRLEKAAHLGLSKIEIENDPNLSSLGENPRYRRILELAS